jgi:hypothetical protein
MSLIRSMDVWADVARVCGLPIAGVRRAVVTFDIEKPVEAEIDMFAIVPCQPGHEVWSVIGAGFVSRLEGNS